MTAKQTVKAICEALLEKKAQDIQVLQVERLTELTEYFVICSATSTTQVKSLADNVEWRLKYDHETVVHHTEGYESAQWMLLDYGCVVLHVFMPEARKFYNLENLWKDGTPVPLAELGIEDE
ncbi:MAG TPA: ribosome silencing factor [Candidatus Agathobaculum stercoravium]|nr:ribosome silencing factor [uncultured Agathobaculum sp.]HIV97911.1 ribosome silencing factor [Candidatus Agathobaculum stercoravium]